MIAALLHPKCFSKLPKNNGISRNYKVPNKRLRSCSKELLQNVSLWSRKALWLQAREALWSNCTWRSQTNRNFSFAVQQKLTKGRIIGCPLSTCFFTHEDSNQYHVLLLRTTTVHTLFIRLTAPSNKRRITYSNNLLKRRVLWYGTFRRPNNIY